MSQTTTKRPFELISDEPPSPTIAPPTPPADVTDPVIVELVIVTRYGFCFNIHHARFQVD